MVAGPSLKSWGATQNGWLSHARINKVWGFGARSLWFNQWDYEARYENKLIQNGILKLKSQYFYLFRDTKQSAFIRTEYTGSKNLDSEDQFLLGGENGLRGYSVRQFSGSKKLLVTVETRRVIIYDWLHLMHLGWAVFGDSGAAWKEHTSLDKKDFKSDVGLGLRLAPSRSFDPGLIRIDVAYALNDNNRDHRWVINIGGQLSFGEKSERKFDQ
jgi:outer membrane translocation and assembly module TamA